jgi:hypothetical protein
MLSFHFPLLTNLLLFVVTASVLVGLAQFGRRRGLRFVQGLNEDPPGLAQIEGAVFGLFGLLVALTFIGAVDRFQDRRALILQEAQSVGTAYARLDLLPEEPRRELQGLFRSYLALRLEAYALLADPDDFDAKIRIAEAEGEKIWSLAAKTCRDAQNRDFAEVVLPAINEMNDLALARKAALRTHPPAAIYGFLFILAMACAFLVGFSTARSARLSRTHIVGFALITALTIALTLDIEHPRFGVVRVDASDALLKRALESMR